MLKCWIVVFFALITMTQAGFAQQTKTSVTTETNVLDELDPFAPDIDEQLKQLDQNYMEETGKLPYMFDFYQSSTNHCYRVECSVFAYVSKREQKMHLYLNGELIAEWLVSTGAPGHGTPDFDKNPDGRIYDRYTSKRYPGGDYAGMGNMPYAVFIYNGFAIHGTGEGNWKRLGARASHGCIRLHPDNAFQFNRLVREYGIQDTWITVAD